ncbi:MAG: type III secretion system export apparatus subunit SctT [Salinarimonas sp.]
MEADAILTAWLERYMVTGLAFTMGFVRIIAVLQIFPLFTALNVRGTIRATLALVLAMPLVPIIEPQLQAIEMPTLWDYGLLMAKEFIVGLFIGCLIALPFWGIQTAGDVIDVSRGASMANVADPVNANENSLTGLVLLYASLAIFIAAGGFELIVDIIYESYLLLDVTGVLPPLGLETVKAIGGLLTHMFMIGVIISGPIMIAMIAIDLSLVFANRLAKQIQVHDFAMIIKNLCVCAFIPLYAIFLQEYMRNDWRHLVDFARDFMRFESFLD